MSPTERKIHGYQRTSRLEVPKRQRTGRPGRVIHGGAYPLPHDPNITQAMPLFGDSDLGSDSMSHSAAIEYWKKDFEEATKLQGKEASWLNYSGIYFTQTEEAARTVKEMKAKIEAGEPLEGEEKFYTDPEFFRQKLLYKDLTSAELYEYFLIALRMDRIRPERRAEFDTVGFSLGEEADRRSRGYPLYKLANWKEHERKMEEARLRNKKEESDLEKKDPNVRTFHRYNAPEVYEAFTAPYYTEQIRRWQELMHKAAIGHEIDWLLFKREYERFVKFAAKLRSHRGYDRNQQMFHPEEYDEALRKNDPEAFFKGLAGLYAVRKGQEKIVEPKAIELLARSADLPPPPKYTHRWPQPWKVFVLYVGTQELYRLLGTIDTVGKRVAKHHKFNDMLLHQRGGVPEHLKGTKELNYEKPDKDEELPF